MTLHNIEGKEIYVKKSEILCGLLSACLLFFVACLMGAYPGNVGRIGDGNWIQGSPLATYQTHDAGGAGGFTFVATKAYLSSGGTAATSQPCNVVIMTLAGTGVVTVTGTASLSGGTTTTSGLAFATASTSTFTAPWQINTASNLNTIQISGTGQLGYIWSN
jgi:hypothetical protein